MPAEMDMHLDERGSYIETAKGKGNFRLNLNSSYGKYYLQKDWREEVGEKASSLFFQIIIHLGNL